MGERESLEGKKESRWHAHLWGHHHHHHPEHEHQQQHKASEKATSTTTPPAEPFTPPRYDTGIPLQQVWSTGHIVDAGLALSALEEHQQLHQEHQGHVYHGHVAGVSTCSCNDLPGSGPAAAISGAAPDSKVSGNKSGRPFMPPLEHIKSAPCAYTLHQRPDDHLTRKGTRTNASFAATHKLQRVLTADGEEIKIKVHGKDINPLPGMWHILKQPHNILTLTFSGLTFASQYSLAFTVSYSAQSSLGDRETADPYLPCNR